MKLHTIKPADGSVKQSKRIGRGIGSGHGKTSTKGHKGQWARRGGGVRPGFEGGQMPLVRRLPKRGFKNMFKSEFSIVNVGSLDVFDAGTVVDADLLLNSRIIGKIEKDGLKVLGEGELTKSLTVKAAKFSKTAIEKIEKAGGKIEVL